MSWERYFEEQVAAGRTKAKAKLKAPAPAEHEEQRKIFEWAEWSIGRLPELEMLFAVPNGGRRDKATAARLKAEGVKAGVPDIILPVPRGGYAGLWIELKRRPNEPTEQQQRWLERLRGHGCMAGVCYSAEEAIAAIEDYLRGAEWRPLMRRCGLCEWVGLRESSNGQ